MDQFLFQSPKTSEDHVMDLCRRDRVIPRRLRLRLRHHNRSSSIIEISTFDPLWQKVIAEDELGSAMWNYLSCNVDDGRVGGKGYIW